MIKYNSHFKKLRGLSPRTAPAEWLLLVGEVSTKFADRRCHMVSVMDPYDRILDFLARSPYSFFQVAPQLYSRGWVDQVIHIYNCYMKLPELFWTSRSLA
jgi:hypothetical protein